jgi:phage anti-repressor protein
MAARTGGQKFATALSIARTCVILQIRTDQLFGTGNIGGDLIQTVNARDLHVFLEVGKDFSTWIKDRVAAFGFVENQDFVLDSPISGNQVSHGGDRRSIQYHLTLDTAKELSMVERNAKGKQARQYFIECECVAKPVLFFWRNSKREESLWQKSALRFSQWHWSYLFPSEYGG